jgi:hypothetical protein
MAETKVCAVCAKPEDFVRDGGSTIPDELHNLANCQPSWDGSCPTAFYPDHGHHPFIETHSANCGRSYAAKAQEPADWDAVQAGTLTAEQIEDEPDGPLTPSEILAILAENHRLRNGQSTDHDLLEALIPKIDSMSALLEKRLPAWQYVAPDKPLPGTGGNGPYAPWVPWYPSTVKPFGWPQTTPVIFNTAGSK